MSVGWEGTWFEGKEEGVSSRPAPCAACSAAVETTLPLRDISIGGGERVLVQISLVIKLPIRTKWGSKDKIGFEIRLSLWARW